MMNTYYDSRRFELPTIMKHGVGVLSELPATIRELGVTKPLIVTDPGVANAGILNKVITTLEDAGIPYAVFDRVVANPPVETVGDATTSYQNNNCDGLIGLGGGSSMDTAKGVGVEVTHEGNILDWEAEKRDLQNRIAPLITISTTAGTGSEVTMWAVITDSARKFKFNVGGPLLAPHVSIVDPVLHSYMPPHVTAGTGMDALCHAIECYTCHYAQPHTDAVALLAIEYCAKYLRRAVANGKDMEARYYMAMAAHLAGISYGSDSAGAVHALTQTLGGIKPEIHHGPAVGATLAPTMEYNWIGEPEKFTRIAVAMGEDITGMTERESCLAGIEAIYQLAEDIGIPTLTDLGVTEDQIPMLARAAEGDPQTVGNPRDIDAKGYEWIYKRCFGLV
ncbi:MAG: iron-containing alcohol dehydrogenase [Clostridiales bacterium]|nr:iron-containing alcohol dehydrogenase [Clostridiales bacterium]MCF8021466.1 iron-containing alcohol dehydrogenase [Clostridiales bacterium]